MTMLHSSEYFVVVPASRRYTRHEPALKLRFHALPVDCLRLSVASSLECSMAESLTI